MLAGKHVTQDGALDGLKSADGYGHPFAANIKRDGIAVKLVLVFDNNNFLFPCLSFVCKALLLVYHLSLVLLMQI